jgi:hypothetical protein
LINQAVTLTGINISLVAADNVYINGPITLVGDYYLFIESYSGSIVPGILEGNDLYHINSQGDAVLMSGGIIGMATEVRVDLDNPLRVLIGGELDLLVEDVVEGLSGVLTGSTGAGNTVQDIDLLNTPPGLVYFNNLPVPPPAPITPPDTGTIEPTPEPEQEPEIGSPIGSIIANQPEVVNPVDLDSLQFNSAIGTLFSYHPIAPTDMVQFDRVMIGADAYQLQNGELKLIGHDGLLQFFQEFDQKRQQL